jgi:hypothetical protein
MRFLLPFLVLLVLALPAWAGSPTAPEIQDGTQDVDALYPGGPATTLGAPEIDLTMAWFTPTPVTVRVSWAVVDATHRAQQDEALDYVMTATCGTDRVLVAVTLTPGMPTAEIHLQPTAGPSVSRVLAFGVEGNVVHADVPRELLMCDNLAHTLASSALSFHVGNNWTPGALVGWRDEAPNTGYGADATLT